jgi:hypothetical protein
MLIHKSRVPYWEWQNFSLKTDVMLACPCCGEFYFDTESLNKLQIARNIIDKPLLINSGHRCGIYNALIGGAALSMHKKIAFDISLFQHDRQHIIRGFRAAGFRGFGFYQTFLHVDNGRPRYWYGKGAEKLWNF